MFADIPVGRPPKGVKSDFNAQAEGKDTLYVLNFLTLSLVVITVTIRFYVKRFVSKQKFSWDDVFCFLAMVSCLQPFTYASS
jgi:high-affinity Fe2+/Pb2+ permease